MRFSSLLMQIGTLVASAGCTSSADTPQPPLDISSADACTILTEGQHEAGYGDSVFSSARCRQLCAPPYSVCIFPSDFVDAYDAANKGVHDAGAYTDAGVYIPVCPSSPIVHIHCAVDGTGRLTAGASEFAGDAGAGRLGRYLAECAHLEAVSVLAFQRLARELRAQRAPDELCAAAESAAGEEARHAEQMDALAARFGATREQARLDGQNRPRTLLEVALENAVEGCVRETYGAALGVLRASRASCPEVKATLAKIARDECGHAELSWRVLSWHLGRLDHGGRLAIARAMAIARRALAEQILRDGTMGLCTIDEALLGMPTVREKLLLLEAVEERAFFQAA
jgi:hypothetical protein